MRTTLDLPENLVEEARRLLGFKSKTDTIVQSLTELVRRRRIDELKSVWGQVKLELDIPASRRRRATLVGRRGLRAHGASRLHRVPPASRSVDPRARPRGEHLLAGLGVVNQEANGLALSPASPP